jgi:hypothetical protein
MVQGAHHSVILSEAKNLGSILGAPAEIGQSCFAPLNMTASFTIEISDEF